MTDRDDAPSEDEAWDETWNAAGEDLEDTLVSFHSLSENQRPRALLVAVHPQGAQESARTSLEELALLLDTAGVEAVCGVTQKRDQPDPGTYLGKGKVQEVRDLVLSEGVESVVADHELTPTQLRNLEEALHVPVADRTAVILDIFAQHARSKEGATQVELAQLSYLLPRLTGSGQELEQQGGGIGTRFGPGETKLEKDRRRIRTRITKLQKELKSLTRTRETTRSRRRDAGIPSVALVGYTNAGKSSLLRALTGAEVLVADQLFATLDPAVRRARTPEGRVFTLSDTVGFVNQLPHQLVEAFRSTLEEVRDADLLLHVVDASDPHWEERIQAVTEVLREIGAESVPSLLVANKMDVAAPEDLSALERRGGVAVSALTGEGTDLLVQRISEEMGGLVEVDALIPYTHGELVHQVHLDAEVISEEHEESGTHIRARVRPELAARLGEL